MFHLLFIRSAAIDPRVGANSLEHLDIHISPGRNVFLLFRENNPTYSSRYLRTSLLTGIEPPALLTFSLMYRKLFGFLRRTSNVRD